MRPLSVSAWAPCRVSLFGGGSDFPEFFHREPGAVLGAALTLGMSVRVERRSRRGRGAGDLASACANALGVPGHYAYEVASTDLCGAGLASSSALAVAVATAIATLAEHPVDAATLAEVACRVEHRFLRRAGGKQDQYFAAFGGLRHIVFSPDGTVDVHSLDCTPASLASLHSHLLVFDTGRRRDADPILRRQAEIAETRRREIRRLVELAGEARRNLEGDADLAAIGALLDEAWAIKRGLTEHITFGQADEWYGIAIRSGAYGGKLLGAGGGGHMVFVAPPERHDAIRAALGHPLERRFAIGPAAKCSMDRAFTSAESDPWSCHA